MTRSYSEMPAHEPKSLLLVSSSLNHGGAERFASTLLQNLDRARIRPELCLMREDIGYPLPADVPIHILDYRRTRQYPWMVARLRRLIEEIRPDVILSNLHGTNVATGLALRGSDHQPGWVGRIASNPADNDGILGTILARLTYPRADSLAANSRGLIRGIARRYPSTASKLQVRTNPTDFEAIDRLAGEPAAQLKPPGVLLLIAVGRLGPEKRYDLMIDAFERLNERHEVALWICGSGPRERALRSQIRRRALTDSIHLLGHHPNPYALMRQADVYVLCSDYEGLPNALIEAQGLGLPAVSTRCPYGPDEIIEDGRTGYLTPVGDSAALAAATSEILTNQELRRRMATEARMLARERFDAKPLTRAWEDLLLRQARATSLGS